LTDPEQRIVQGHRVPKLVPIRLFAKANLDDERTINFRGAGKNCE